VALEAGPGPSFADEAGPSQASCGGVARFKRTPVLDQRVYGLWQTRFGGDPGVIGRTLTLEGQPLQVPGVMPAGFRGLTGAAELWIGTRSFRG